MKLTKSQKKILKSIPNEKTRLEQKLQFKLQNRFFSRQPIIFIDGKFETDNPQIIEFLSNHPMCEKENLTESAKCHICHTFPKTKGKEKCLSCYSVLRHALESEGYVFGEDGLGRKPEEKESKVKVEMVKDEKLKGTRYENCFFKVTIPIGTPIQDSLNAVDEFFKQKPVNFPELTSREKALYKIIEMRREFDESANNNPKQFTLEDMRNCFDAGMKSCKFHLGYKHIDFDNYIDSLKNS